jgi:hypothetical protein
MLYGSWSTVKNTLQSDAVQDLALNSAAMLQQPPTAAKAA